MENSSANNSKEISLVADEKIKQLQKELAHVRGQKISKLGDGEVFFLREGDKVRRGFVSRVILDCPEDFCYPMRKPDSQSMITGAGFDKLNQISNIDIVPAPFVVTHEGRKEGASWMDIDPVTHSVRGVFLHYIGVGYAPTGNLAVIDRSVYVHLGTLLIQEIQGKLKKYPGLGMIGTADKRPDQIFTFAKSGKGYNAIYSEEPTGKELKGYWEFLPTTDKFGYWINLSHPVMMDAWEGWTQKQRFVERSAMTVLKRIILSNHPAIAKKSPDGVYDLKIKEGDWPEVISGKGYASVYGFLPIITTREALDKRSEEIRDVAIRVANGEKMSDVTVQHAEAEDASVSPEMGDPIAAGADSSEVLVNDRDDSEPDTVESKPVPEEKKVFDLDMIFSSIGDKAIAGKVKAEMRLATYGDLKAKPELSVEFCRRYNEMLEAKK